jgi:hypothetical protein
MANLNSVNWPHSSCLAIHRTRWNFSGVDSERSKTYMYRQQAEFVFDEKIGILEATARFTPSSRILMMAKTDSHRLPCK